MAAKHGLHAIPKLIEIIAALPEQHRERLAPFLRTKPVRSASGVAVVAVMCKPHRCPHLAFTGSVCAYCPGGPDSDFEYSTQAYTGYEPTSMRAIRARYDPFLQTRARLEQLHSLGHSTDKVEFIIMGGTFLSMDAEYRDGFIRRVVCLHLGRFLWPLGAPFHSNPHFDTKNTLLLFAHSPTWTLQGSPRRPLWAHQRHCRGGCGLQ